MEKQSRYIDNSNSKFCGVHILKSKRHISHGDITRSPNSEEVGTEELAEPVSWYQPWQHSERWYHSQDKEMGEKKMIYCDLA